MDQVTGADASAAAGETGIGRRRRPGNLLLAHLSDVRKEINQLVGGAAEVRSQIMTTEFDVQSSGSEPMDGDTTAQVCGACGHTRLSHDATAKRFCRASRDRALDRVCVCAIRAGSTVRRSEAPMYGRGRPSRTSCQPTAPCPGAQRGACWRWIQLTLTRSGSRGGSRGVWFPRSAPLTVAPRPHGWAQNALPRRSPHR
jgi:hypothetical protein